MPATQISIAQQSCRINGAGYPYFSCPHKSPVKVEHIVSKARNNSSSVNIKNIKVLNFGVMCKKINADIGQT
jgi:hypothetical protein